MAASRLEQKYQAVKEQLQGQLGNACKADPSICAVLLVAVRAHRHGSTWEPKPLVAQLLLSGSEDWKTLAGRPPAFKRAGKTNPLTKPSLQEVCDKLGKGEVCPAMRQQLFHLKHFLQVLKLPLHFFEEADCRFPSDVDASWSAVEVQTGEKPRDTWQTTLDGNQNNVQGIG